MNKTITEKMEALADRLIAYTESGRLPWKSVGVDLFEARVDALVVTVSRFGGAHYFRVFKEDPDRRMLEELVANAGVRRLFEEARRRAMHADEAIEHLLSYLDSQAHEADTE